MKRLFPIILTLMLILTLAITGCGGSSGGGGGNPGGGNPGGGDPGGDDPGGTIDTPVPSLTCNVGGVSFIMYQAPGGSFTSDDNTVTNDQNLPGGPGHEQITVANAYWIAETEVTYQLWSVVYKWATGDTDMDGIIHNGETAGTYTIVHTGVMGDGTGDNEKHPVTTVNWREAMVWCNALTEYYNANNGSEPDLDCAYYTDVSYNTPIRTSTINNVVPSPLVSGEEDQPYIKAETTGNIDPANCTAKGFRLPTSNEWELAARYQDGKTWTPGNHVSGDTTSYCYSNPPDAGRSTVFVNYAWYATNSGNSTHPVGDKTANALNIKDMSGNVWEWCFDWYPGYEGNYRVRRGGNWLYPSFYLQIGEVSNDTPVHVDNILGFRIARFQ